MGRYIDKDALIEKIKKRLHKYEKEYERLAHYEIWNTAKEIEPKIKELKDLLSFIDTLEAKEVNWEKERIEECPYRQVGCTMYEGKILECRGACSWVVDYPKLKKLKAQKGE